MIVFLDLLPDRLTTREAQLREHSSCPSDRAYSFPVEPDRSVILCSLDQSSGSKEGIMDSCVDVCFLDQSGLLEYVVIRICAIHLLLLVVFDGDNHCGRMSRNLYQLE